MTFASTLIVAAFEMPLGEAAFIAVLGLLIVFAVLAVLVGILWIFKAVFSIKIGKKTQNVAVTDNAAVSCDDDSDELIAAITAALACMYEEEIVKAPFVIKSIKKLK